MHTIPLEGVQGSRESEVTGAMSWENKPWQYSLMSKKFFINNTKNFNMQSLILKMPVFLHVTYNHCPESWNVICKQLGFLLPTTKNAGLAAANSV